jgi:hypothetical protein
MIKAKITVYDHNRQLVGQPWEIEAIGMAEILLKAAQDPLGLLDYGIAVQIDVLPPAGSGDG